MTALVRSADYSSDMRETRWLSLLLILLSAVATFGSADGQALARGEEPRPLSGGRAASRSLLAGPSCPASIGDQPLSNSSVGAWDTAVAPAVKTFKLTCEYTNEDPEFGH